MYGTGASGCDRHLAMETLDEARAAVGARVEQLDRCGLAAVERGRVVDLAHRAAAEHEAEAIAAHDLPGPPAFVDALLARGIVLDLGERLLLIADHAHRARELGERGRAGVARPPAERVARHEEHDDQHLGDRELARLGEHARQHADVLDPAQHHRDREREVTADADRDDRHRRPAMAAERDEHRAEHQHHDHGGERAEVIERGDHAGRRG